MDRELAVVTGASRGIGKAIALKLAAENRDVMLFGRDVSALEDVQKMIKKLGVEADIFSGDAADVKFVNESVKKILDKYGKIDHLINNAGVGIVKKLVDSTLEDFKKQVNVNLYGVYNFTKAVADNMIKRRNGSIINIASLAGKNSFIGGTMYSATKHALLGFTRSLMLEIREYNIRVAAICPGSVDTSFGSSSAMDPRSKGEILKPEDIAECVAAIIKLPARALMSEIDLRPTNPK
ncbi:MAG TPA: SDR family NAD(P)-dependent oxidoreductase [Ignavibacteriaceae bacterium]|nr:SDR family NAD(P)-dependent oxidoreductase [Ignavibacteriaceae bacterium]